MPYCPEKYDIDDLYSLKHDTPMAELLLPSLLDRFSKDVMSYRAKLIVAGNNVDVMLYPVLVNRRSFRAKKYKESRTAQAVLNYNNACKRLIRLVNANFTDADMWGTTTYADEHIPKTKEEADRNMQKFIRRLRIHAKRHGFPPLKYVYVTHFADQRVNHHIVINFPDRDAFEKLWEHGARKEARRLQADKFGYTGLATYIMQDASRKKRYVASRGLKQPEEEYKDNFVTRSMSHKLATGRIDPCSFFEKLAKKFKLTKNRDCAFLEMNKPATSDYISGVYLYARMRCQT